MPERVVNPPSRWKPPPKVFVPAVMLSVLPPALTNDAALSPVTLPLQAMAPAKPVVSRPPAPSAKVEPAARLTASSSRSSPPMSNVAAALPSETVALRICPVLARRTLPLPIWSRPKNDGLLPEMRSCPAPFLASAVFRVMEYGTPSSGPASSSVALAFVTVRVLVVVKLLPCGADVSRMVRGRTKVDGLAGAAVKASVPPCIRSRLPAAPRLALLEKFTVPEVSCVSPS